MITKESLVNDLKNIGVEKGDLLHLKVSMRSLGKIEGGAATLLEALIESVGKEGTLVCDSFIDSYKLPLKGNLENYLVNDKTQSYAGAFARTMVDHPLTIRSQHPIKKFSAIGKRAKELMLNHTANDFAYEPLQIMANEGAKNLTIGKNVVGVGTTHIAVHLCGFERKKPNEGVVYKDEKGNMKVFKVNWNGGHGDFLKFKPLYIEQGGVIKKGNIGNAESILTDMKKTLEIEIKKLKEDPHFFLCDDPACKSCRLSWKHSTGNIVSVYFHLAINKVKKILKIFRKTHK